jgi:PKD repeat protein
MRKLILFFFLFTSNYLFSQSSGFIYGGGNICDNNGFIDVEISFTGTPPWNVIYSIDGINQPIFSTSDNPHIIKTNNEGIYTLSSITDISGTGSTSGSAVVSLLQSPIAKFIMEEDTLSILYPSTKFIDQTSGSASWSWNFGDNTAINTNQNPMHTYDSVVGVYQVKLIVGNNDNCYDTTTNQIWVNNEYYIYIPNSFTPDLDGINDNFCIYYNGIRESTFNFKIYNLRGDVIFITNNLNDISCNNLDKNGWNGTHKDSGKEIPVGNYVYEISFQDFDGWKHREFNYIRVIR